MSWIAWIIFGFGFVAIALLLVAILATQKSLDAPMNGILLVDHQEEEGRPLVYFQAVVDPQTYKDGEVIKLRVKIVKPKSQGKQIAL